MAAAASTPICSGMETLAPRPCDRISWVVPKIQSNADQPKDAAVHEMANFYADLTFGRPECCQCSCNRVTWKGQRTLDQKTVLVELLVYIFGNLPARFPRNEKLMAKLAEIISSRIMERKGLPVPRPRTGLSGQEQQQDDEMDGSFQAGQHQAQLNDSDIGELCNFLRTLTILQE